MNIAMISHLVSDAKKTLLFNENQNVCLFSGTALRKVKNYLTKESVIRAMVIEIYKASSNTLPMHQCVNGIVLNFPGGGTPINFG